MIKEVLEGIFFHQIIFTQYNTIALFPLMESQKSNMSRQLFCHTHAQMAKAGHINYRIFRLVFLSDFFTLLMFIGAITMLKKYQTYTRKFRIWHHFLARVYILHKKVILILRKKGSTTVSNASLAKSMKGKNFMYEPTYTLWWCTKGQLISKCLFGVFNSSKKNERKQFNLRYHSTLADSGFLLDC